MTNSRDDHIDAGPFSTWLQGLLDVLDGNCTSDVPCGTCTACCTSSQFVYIEPDEIDTLAHIPKGALAPAPGRPRGHMVMGYDARGHCPMLIDGKCSIYEHRPRTCRVYDCRVFAAAGVDPGDDKPDLQRQVPRWSFALLTERDRRDYESVRAAATTLEPDPNTTHQAVVAIRIAAGR